MDSSAPTPDRGHDDDIVVVQGTGRAAAPPDTLVLDLQLEGRGSTVAEALDALTAASRACHEALADLSVRTQGLGVHPRHDNHGRQAGHAAYQQLLVRTPDPGTAGELVQRLSGVVADALGVNGLRPELTRTGGLDTLARERAFAEARARAEQYAALADRGLGPVRQVREGVVGGPRPMEQMAFARAADAAGPVVDAADHEVTVTVQVTWSLV